MNASTITAKRELISFGRFSSDKQEEGDSTQRQEEAYAELCERYSDRAFMSENYKFGTFFGKGESGSKMKHLKNGGSLKRFLDEIGIKFTLTYDEKGKVNGARTEKFAGKLDPNKTALAIERWNRFSRFDVDLAIVLLSAIVRSGCALAIRRPKMWIDSVETFQEEIGDITDKLRDARDEAKDREGYSLRARAKIRATGKTKSTREFPEGRKPKSCPCWICPTPDGKAYKKVEASDLLRKDIRKGSVLAETMYKACLAAIAGDGQTKIARELNLNVNALTPMFRSRTLLGKYQPRLADGSEAGKERDEYPALLEENEHLRLQDSLNSRVHHKGSRSAKVTNLFTDLCFAPDGTEIRTKDLHAKRKNGIKITTVLCHYFGANKWGKSVKYPMVEDALLDLFLGLTREDLFPKDTTAEQKQVLNLEAKILDKKGTAEAISKKIKGQNGARFLELLDETETEITQLETELEALKTALVVSSVDHLGQVQQFTSEHLEGKGGAELLELRTRLREAISKVCVKVVIDIHSPDACSLQVHLTNGNTVSVSAGGVAKANGLQVAMLEY